MRFSNSEQVASRSPLIGSAAPSDIAPRSSSQEDDLPRNQSQGFSILTKVIVLVLMALSMSITQQPAYSAVLTASLLVYLALDGHRSLAIKLVVSYLVISALYATMIYLGFKVLFFSSIHIFIAWKAYPVIISSVALVTSPPGTISAFLAKLHFPKKLIVGALVIFRFFPTMKVGLRQLSEALKNRGLITVSQVARNPIDTLEYLLVPTMTTLINSADQLSSSAITRAAEAPTRRTSYYHNGQDFRDYLCQFVFLVIAVAFMWFT